VLRGCSPSPRTASAVSAPISVNDEHETLQTSVSTDGDAPVREPLSWEQPGAAESLSWEQPPPAVEPEIHEPEPPPPPPPPAAEAPAPPAQEPPAARRAPAPAPEEPAIEWETPPSPNANAYFAENPIQPGAPTPEMPPPTPPVHVAQGTADEGDDGEPPSKPKIHKLRLFMIMLGLGLIAFVSTIFGIMMAVSTDLPKLENRAQYRSAKNSTLLDINGKPLGVLTDKNNRILVQSKDISASMKHAIIAIEDKRFYQHDGVDYRGIGRALYQDILHKSSVQGASTIPQQFVKNALAAQNKRTVLEKLREAALAYHLNRKWSKSKILKEYLNSVYFGNGAYGIESAASIYWSWTHPGCGEDGAPLCASVLDPAESAMIAGVVASPSGYDPIAHPAAGRKRRNQVLKNMLDQSYLTKTEYQHALNEPLPTRDVLTLPEEKSKAPYFTTWIKQQVVNRFGAQRAFNGGLKIRTTIDLDLQNAAQQAVENHLPDRSGPRAALVAIDNKTGEVRAMVGGDDYSERPFNLATNGQRQPGSSFKPFVLAAALTKGISPNSIWASKRKDFIVPNSGGKEHFIVNNYDNEYSGSLSLASATTVSDNSVYAEVGLKTGLKRIARLATRMGIRTPVSHNPAMSLGGLKEGVTPLDMAHAYETFAEDGDRVTGTLGGDNDGPVGIHAVKVAGGKTIKNQRVTKRIISKKVAETETAILQTVVTSGTGKAAQIGDFAAGKTGTTENYGDAWFVGFTKSYTVAVWVGYPNKLRSMLTEFNGGPVAGGTFPAQIWHDFMASAMQIDAQRAAAKAAKEGKPPPAIPTYSSAPQQAVPQTGVTGTGTGTGATGGAGTGGQATPQQGTGQTGTGTGNTQGTGNGQGTGTPTPTPKPQTPPTPAPAQQTPPTGGTGGGTGAGAAAPTG
jgi:penicillin-binding protein 1A